VTRGKRKIIAITTIAAITKELRPGISNMELADMPFIRPMSPGSHHEESNSKPEDRLWATAIG
jgi:hypothetical protein